jgi:quercetin dioxygenase-like cupin family protein
MTLAIVGGFGLGGCEAYPGVFGIFAGFADDAKVEDGYLKLPDRPGIGFEGQNALYAVVSERRADGSVLEKSATNDACHDPFPETASRPSEIRWAFRRVQAGGEELRRPLCVVPGRHVIPPHSHETDNVGVITQGELILTLDGVESRYGPGDWYHVCARAIHSARFEVETSEIEFWFHTA